MNQLNPDFRRSLTDSGFPPFIRLADDLENTPPSVGIRLNPRKPGAVPPEGARPVPWHPRAYLLDTRPEFTLDPAMHQGAYYVQDPSSMFVAEILRQILPDLPPRPRVLDLCAAPGGKSTALADLLPDGSLLVSNEYDFRRAEILKENIIKWGYPWSIVTRGDTSRFRRLPGYFDLIVVDAPCSGEGMSRKDPKAREQWSPSLVAQCATLQEEILANAAAALRPGGYLIYSTCTFNTAENEARTAPLLASDFTYCPIEVDPAWGILTEAPEPTPYPSLRFLPGRVEGEGYTVALLRKNGTPAPLPAPSPRGKKQPK
ncbi:MAG: RsmB/NOP family class I SAM-dependent RNA methyltransferase, partial [Alistipes timonensis]|nr:RsmB/NOP family class I SAM-dependent RNA methyltransferase [Alistipes timonensis]